MKLLYIELDSFVYYNDSMVTTPNDLKTKIINSLTNYSKSTDLNKFGGRFRYSKVLRTIDSTDTSITSNITRVKIRRNLFILFILPIYQIQIKKLELFLSSKICQMEL